MQHIAGKVCTKQQQKQDENVPNQIQNDLGATSNHAVSSQSDLFYHFSIEC
jgi:hypothetical protein